MRVKNSLLNRPSVFITFVYVTIDWSSRETKDEFYCDLPQLIRTVHSTEVIVNVSAFTPNLVTKTEMHFAGPFSVPVDRTNRSDGFVQVCST